MENKVIYTQTACFKMDDRGFLRVEFLENDHDFDEDEAHKHIDAGAQITGGRFVAVLADVRKGYHVPTVDAKKILASFTNKYAEAIIVNSSAKRIMGNFYLRIIKKDKPDFPVRIFTNQDDAVNWLMPYVKDSEI